MKPWNACHSVVLLAKVVECFIGWILVEISETNHCCDLPRVWIILPRFGQGRIIQSIIVPSQIL